MICKFVFSLVFIFNVFHIKLYQNYIENKKIGEIIKGDFDGDGKLETARLVKVKQGFGNPIEDGEPDDYEIQFSSKKMRPIKIGCCEAILVNEGDLNNDKKDEISIYQAPMNGCVYRMQTFTFFKSEWKLVFEPFLYPTACDELTFTEIENLVVKEKDSIFYYTIDTEEWKLIKQKAKK